MKPAIAFFDFDGTITRRDTLFEIIRFQKGEGALYAGLALLSPALVMMKLGLISKQKGKDLVLQYFFRNTPIDEFRDKCAAFCRDKLPGLIRENALKEINQHLAKGHRVVVVTASAQEWVKPWCDNVGIECIGTQLEIRNDRVTGRIHGVNCNGEEKVRRIRQQYDLPVFGDIYAYGDTNGDRPMLQLATFGFFRKF
ncbi:HAD family hydrolase [Chitinophaga filiformis]|uniref:HAD-superfamily subfamily IB hydrolase, TIGR01490 n=1 Tax=Chitinophaga filiformis TaxID=104663 RepID=A0A1G7ZJ12_CHIFI|nr:HAD family hydrolase [Chitinophaga filiformis]SDH08605.1 HAD-superfamily subfamily IB hydrolase, TIGR01490 [Chitinophaga filiformis]